MPNRRMADGVAVGLDSSRRELRDTARRVVVDDPLGRQPAQHFLGDEMLQMDRLAEPDHGIVFFGS